MNVYYQVPISIFPLNSHTIVTSVVSSMFMVLSSLWPLACCKVVQKSPGPDPLFRVFRGPNPMSCLPALAHISSYKRHMWDCRKADAVSPFVKSSFWKAVSILMARVKSLGSEEAPDSVVWSFMLTLQDLMLTENIPISQCNIVLSVCAHLSSGKHIQFQRHAAQSSDEYSSETEQFICWSSAHTIRGWGRVLWRKKPKWNDSFPHHPSPSAASISACPQTSAINHSSMEGYDKPDTCQSLTDGTERTAAYTAPHVTPEH